MTFPVIHSDNKLGLNFLWKKSNFRNFPQLIIRSQSFYDSENYVFLTTVEKLLTTCRFVEKKFLSLWKIF